MASQTSHFEKQASVLIMMLGYVTLISSCVMPGAGGKPVQPIDVNAATPAPSGTLEPTEITLSLTTTPTLGISSIWRKSRIAFASDRTGTFQIYLMNPDGSDLVQLTNAAGDNLSPAWSPDAKHIVFESTRDGNSEIYTMNPDGTEQKNLTQNLSIDDSPIWIPGGKIAFVSDRKGRERIFLMNSDGTDIRAFQYTSIESTGQFICLTSPAEGFVSFTVEDGDVREVRVLDTASGKATTPDTFNAEHDHSCPQLPSLVTNPWFVFISNRNGHDDIYKQHMYNDSEVQLTQDSSSMGPSLSSDEDWFTFYSKRTGNWDIFIMDFDGENQWNITNDPADDIQPAWEPF